MCVYVVYIYPVPGLHARFPGWEWRGQDGTHISGTAGRQTHQGYNEQYLVLQIKSEPCVQSQTVPRSVPGCPVFSPSQSCVQSQPVPCSVPACPVFSPSLSCVQSQPVLCSVPDCPVFSPRLSCVQSQTVPCSVPDCPVFPLSFDYVMVQQDGSEILERPTSCNGIMCGY